MLRNVTYTPEQSPYWLVNEFSIFMLSNICNGYLKVKKRRRIWCFHKWLAQQFPWHRMNGKITLGMQGDLLTHGKSSSDWWLQCGQEACNRGSIERIRFEHWEFPPELSVEVMKKANRTTLVSSSLGQDPWPYNIYWIAQYSIGYGTVGMLWQLLPKWAALGWHTH